MKKISRVQRLQRGGYNVGWIIPVNMVGFSLLTMIALSDGLLALVVCGLLYLPILKFIASRVEASSAQSRKVVRRQVQSTATRRTKVVKNAKQQPRIAFRNSPAFN
jgi:hypothetical protein